MATLPSELFIKIIEEASALHAPLTLTQHPAPRLNNQKFWDNKALRNLSLVNHAFRDIAQSLLFNSLAFTTANGIRGRLVGVRASSLCDYVRHLRFSPLIYSFDGSGNGFENAFAMILRLFVQSCSKNLRSLVLAVNLNTLPYDAVRRQMARMAAHFGELLGSINFPMLEGLLLDGIRLKDSVFICVGGNQESYLRNVEHLKESWISRTQYGRFGEQEFKDHELQCLPSGECEDFLRPLLETGNLERVRWDCLTSEMLNISFHNTTRLTKLNLTRMFLSPGLGGAILYNPGLVEVDLQCVRMWDPELIAPWSVVFTQIRSLKKLKKLSLHELGYDMPTSEECTYAYASVAYLHSYYTYTIRTGLKADIKELETLWEMQGVEMYPRKWEHVWHLLWSEE